MVLHKSGDIVFNYKTIPIPIELLKNDANPVKIGLSDAYVAERNIFCKFGISICGIVKHLIGFNVIVY